MAVFERTATIHNELGLHARAAAVFVRLSTTFKSDIFVQCRDIEVDGKSIMGVMMLTAAKGSTLIVRASGADGERAVEELAELVENRFGEEK